MINKPANKLVILNWILAFLSGGLLAAVFPPHNLVWLAPLAIAPLLFAAAREDRWHWPRRSRWASSRHWPGLS